MAHDHDAHDHSAPRAVERRTDVAVVGGSAAGLAAALQLGRTRTDTIVVDGGEPRNGPATHAHGYLGHEGVEPGRLTAIGREEVRSYGVEVLDRQVAGVERLDDGRFRLDLGAGDAIVARRVLAATGLVDQLPDVDGLADHWGHDVIHCPFCHGYEVRDRRLVQLVVHPLGFHLTPLLHRLAGELTVVVHDGIDGDDPELGRLREAGIRVVEGPARRVLELDGAVVGVELSDGAVVETDAVLTGVTVRARTEPFVDLGLVATAHPSGLGTHVEVDATGRTGVPGVYAAGNVADPAQQLLQAAAHGSFVGAQIAFDLAAEDLDAGVGLLSGQAAWDERFGGEPTFSGNPNGTLVAEVEELTPGRALDVGAGEGADAVWLAGQGWEVTATDVSERALDHVGAAAAREGVAVECRHADAAALRPFGPEVFDLVSAQYAVIPRSPDERGVENLLAAVAPGGTLLVVHHDGEALGALADRPPVFDGAAMVTPADVARAALASPDCDVVVDEARHRPGGHNTVDAPDLVVRARRRG